MSAVSSAYGFGRNPTNSYPGYSPSLFLKLYFRVLHYLFLGAKLRISDLDFWLSITIFTIGGKGPQPWYPRRARKSPSGISVAD